MGSIIHSLIDLDQHARLMMMKVIVESAKSEGIISEDEEESVVKMWLAELTMLDGIKENIYAQGLLNKDQKEYIWSIVMEGV